MKIAAQSVVKLAHIAPTVTSNGPFSRHALTSVKVFSRTWRHVGLIVLNCWNIDYYECSVSEFYSTGQFLWCPLGPLEVEGSGSFNCL